ncbi:MAG: hypothetical protein AAF408_03490 [Pseudomonadota bacterium]
MFRSLALPTRAFLFVVTTIGIWCIWCLGPLLSGDEKAFQAAGSIIVAWAVASWGADRGSRQRIISKYQENAFVSAINAQEAKMRLHEKLSHDTADMHSLSYFKLLRTLGLKDEAVDNQDKAIAELEVAQRDRSETKKLHQEAEFAVKNQIKANREWQLVNSEEEPWVRLLLRIELFFVVLGTIQWGYGDQVLAAIKAQGWL